MAAHVFLMFLDHCCYPSPITRYLPLADLFVQFSTCGALPCFSGRRNYRLRKCSRKAFASILRFHRLPGDCALNLTPHTGLAVWFRICNRWWWLFTGRNSYCPCSYNHSFNFGGEWMCMLAIRQACTMFKLCRECMDLAAVHASAIRAGSFPPLLWRFLNL